MTTTGFELRPAAGSSPEPPDRKSARDPRCGGPTAEVIHRRPDTCVLHCDEDPGAAVASPGARTR